MRRESNRLHRWGRRLRACAVTVGAEGTVATSQTFPFTTSSTPVRRQRSRLSRPSCHLHPSPQGPAPVPSPPELQDGNYRPNRNPSAQQAYPTQTPTTYGQPLAPGAGGSGLEEPRAFHPPTLSSQILHSAARHHHHHQHHQQQHHRTPPQQQQQQQQQQGSLGMDLHEQVRADTVFYSCVSLLKKPPQKTPLIQAGQYSSLLHGDPRPSPRSHHAFV